MKGIAALVLVIEVIGFVAGQVLLKHAMTTARQEGAAKVKVMSLFAGGIAGMTVSFFLTLALLQHFELSYFFPFQSSSIIVVIISAAVFLRERLSTQLILGALLITAGIILVSAS